MLHNNNPCEALCQFIFQNPGQEGLTDFSKMHEFPIDLSEKIDYN